MTNRDAFQPHPTAPLIADINEVPLASAELDRLFSTMQPDMVLVGGQAIAFWLSRFGLDTAGMPVSRDGDVLGTLEQARAIARALNAKLVVPRDLALTSLTAQIRLPRSAGKYSNVDFLHILFTTRGLRESFRFTKDVRKRSVEIELPTGPRFRVMHPLHLLESRMHNAVGLLDEKGPHVVTQLQWAVNIMHCVFLEVLESQATLPQNTVKAEDLSAQMNSRIGAIVERVFKLAKKGVGQQALKLYGIEVLEAIPLDAIEAHNPKAKQQLDVIRTYIAERRALLSTA